MKTYVNTHAYKHMQTYVNTCTYMHTTYIRTYTYMHSGSYLKENYLAHIKAIKKTVPVASQRNSQETAGPTKLGRH